MYLDLWMWIVILHTTIVGLVVSGPWAMLGIEIIILILLKAFAVIYISIYLFLAFTLWLSDYLD